jgi:hypothetical protein
LHVAIVQSDGTNFWPSNKQMRAGLQDSGPSISTAALLYWEVDRRFVVAPT